MATPVTAINILDCLLDPCSIIIRLPITNLSHPGYMTAITADIVNVEADTSRVLGYNGALFERVEDSLDTVVSHGEQKA